MKKFSTVIGGIGFLMAFYAMSCNVEDYPILIVPILIGFGLVYVSYRLEKGWCDFEEEDFEKIDSSDGNSCNDSDDDIVYIEYDRSGHDRYMDM